MFRSIEITLSLPVVLPLLDLLRELVAAVEPARSNPANDRELQTLLELFPTHFSQTGALNISAPKAPAVLRACAFLRIELRQKNLSAISDEALESAKELDPESYTGEAREAVMCYMFLATLQESVFQNRVPQDSPFDFAGRALKKVWAHLGNLFRPRPTASDDAWHPAPSATHVCDAWEVDVLNDPINLMSYVTVAFQMVLGLPEEVAQQRMREVHEKKSSKVWTGPREKAEAHVRALQAWHLKVMLRPPEAK